VISFKSLSDLMNIIDEERPQGNAILFCNLDCVSYLSKLIPEFQLSENYKNVLNTGNGCIGYYQDDAVVVNPLVPSKSIFWTKIPSEFEGIGEVDE